MISRPASRLAWGRHWAVLVALLLVTACGQPAGTGPASPISGEWRSFSGTWTAAGTRHTLELGADHRASVFDLTGSLLLSGENRPAVGFRAKVIGFTDTLAGMHGSSVWTDERGDRVYSELKAEPTGSSGGSQLVVGTIHGGTGRFANVTGDYTFRWQYLVDSDEGAVSGRVVDLKGRVRLAP